MAAPLGAIHPAAGASLALTTAEWVALVVAVFAGSTLQGSLGFGLNLVVAPVAGLVDPDLVPAPLLILGVVHVAALAYRERRDLTFAPVGRTMIGRVPGIVLAVWLLTSVSAEAIEILFGAMLLGVTALSLVRSGLQATRPNLIAAGAAAGITGTTVAVGGPPVALVLADRPNARAEIASVVIVGTTASLVGLVGFGEVGMPDVRIAAALVAPLLLGFACSRVFVGRLDRDRTRVAVHAVAGVAAVALLVRGLA